VGRVDDLQGHRAVQVGVVGFVGNAHGTPAQFPKAAVGAPEELVPLIMGGF